MAITIKCPDCGHTAESRDGASKTCPECEGTMTAPAKKKYQAKATSLEDEDRTKKKSKLREDEDDRPRKKTRPREDEDEPRPKKKAAALSLDDDDDGNAPEPSQDGKAAASLEIDPGFKNRRLMKQVAEELSRGEVLHWAGRMCPEIVEKRAFWVRIGGLIFAAVGALFSAVFFAVAPWFVGLIPIIFVIVGIAIAILGPGAARKQGANGWYAVTDRRAIVFDASPFGSSGNSTSYEPHELRRMRVKIAKSPKGAGDLIFKTKITERRTDYVDQKTRRVVKSETSRSETHYGFLGIEDVREVETLIHNVLLGGARDEEDEDE